VPLEPLPEVQAIADHRRFGRLPFDDPLWSLPLEFVNGLRYVAAVCEQADRRAIEEAGKRGD
jgi:hypothetical protein